MSVSKLKTAMKVLVISPPIAESGLIRVNVSKAAAADLTMMPVYRVVYSTSSGVAVSRDNVASAGLQSMSHHPERRSLVVRSAPSIFSPLCPRMYFAVVLMAARL